ncbi:thiamine pyrophosphate-dependent enzyme [Chloroflexota bacterium]
MSGEIRPMVKQKVAGRPSLLIGRGVTDDTAYFELMCPGCQYGTLGGIIADVLEELNIGGKTVCVGGVGCHSFVALGIQVDMIAAPHGRAPDVATAVKRVRPNLSVFTIQGDGDCIAIGAGALIAAMGRGEKITVLMCNNANYGTTGGQLAPTTIIGQKTPTSPLGRDPVREGYPIHTAELVATFKGVAYSARGSLHTAANYQRTKKYIKTAFEKQIDNVGLSFVEVLSTCPPNWHMTPVDCLDWIDKNVVPEFSLGEFKNVDSIQ